MPRLSIAEVVAANLEKVEELFVQVGQFRDGADLDLWSISLGDSTSGASTTRVSEQQAFIQVGQVDESVLEGIRQSLLQNASLSGRAGIIRTAQWVRRPMKTAQLN